MTDIVFQAPDLDTMIAEAIRVGFTYTGRDLQTHIITNGTFPTGGGWFLNMVGTIYEPYTPAPMGEEQPTPVARPGYWGRLRLNGIPDNLPQFASSIVQYVYNSDLGGWTSDGTTLAPDWIGDVALIA